MQSIELVTLQQETAYNDYMREKSVLDFWLYYRHWCLEKGYFYDA